MTTVTFGAPIQQQPTVTFGPAMPLRDPSLDIPPPNAPVFSMEKKFQPAPPADVPPPVTTTLAPKGGLPHLATPAQEQVYGLIDQMDRNKQVRDNALKGMTPGRSFLTSAGTQYSNNLLAVPSMVGDMLTAPARDIGNLIKGQMPPAMFGSTPRLTVEKIASGARAAEAAAKGQDPVAAYDQARANIDLSQGAVQEAFPISQAAGGVAGDVGSIFSARLPFARLPGAAAATVAKSEAMAPGAARAVVRAWEGLSGKLARPLTKAAETGVESAALAVAHEGDPVKTAAMSAGGQMAGSGLLKLAHMPKTAAGALLGSVMLYSYLQRATPGGPNWILPAVEHSINHMYYGGLLGVAAGALGAGRFKGGSVGSKFADDMPLIADGMNLALRGPMMRTWTDMFKADITSDRPVLGPVLNKVMSDPTVFSESELRQIGTAMQDGSLKPTVDRLLKSNDFRLKVGL